MSMTNDCITALSLLILQNYTERAENSESENLDAAFDINFSNALIIHMVISQSECPILVRCMCLDTQ